MRIDEIRAFNLHFEYPGRRGFRYAGGLVTSRVTTLIRVITNTGAVGWGACYAYPDLAKIIIERHLAPHFIGADPTDVERHWEKMYALTRWYGRKGVALSTLGGLDIAFWDLRGKAVGRPVYRLLGGSRGEVPAYASGLFWQENVAELARETRRHLARGFRQVKMRLGRGLQYDREALQAVAGELGPDCQVIVDGSHRYSMEGAERIGRLLGQYGALWFEEPFPPEDLYRYRELRRRISVPLAMGENEFGYQGFSEMLGAGAVDVAQPDACRAGGLSECRRIGSLAGKLGVRIATHTWSDAVALAANAHFVASIGHGLTVEVDQTGNPFIEELLSSPFQVEGGMLRLSERPGLGVEVNEKALARLALPEGSMIPDGNYSDLQFGAEHWQEAPRYEE